MAVSLGVVVVVVVVVEAGVHRVSILIQNTERILKTILRGAKHP